MTGTYELELSSAMSSIWTMAGNAYTFVTTHEVTALIFAASVMFIGFTVFRKAKKAAY